jgi:hypothetical protein
MSRRGRGNPVEAAVVDTLVDLEVGEFLLNLFSYIIAN